MYKNNFIYLKTICPSMTSAINDYLSKTSEVNATTIYDFTNSLKGLKLTEEEINNIRVEIPLPATTSKDGFVILNNWDYFDRYRTSNVDYYNSLENAFAKFKIVEKYLLDIIDPMPDGMVRGYNSEAWA